MPLNEIILVANSNDDSLELKIFISNAFFLFRWGVSGRQSEGGSYSTDSGVSMTSTQIPCMVFVVVVADVCCCCYMDRCVIFTVTTETQVHSFL